MERKRFDSTGTSRTLVGGARLQCEMIWHSPSWISLCAQALRASLRGTERPLPSATSCFEEGCPFAKTMIRVVQLSVRLVTVWYLQFEVPPIQSVSKPRSS
jgi:hypothetical protein